MKKLKYFISFLISFILLFYIFYNVNIFQIFKTILKANILYYLIAFLCFYLSILLKAFRWDLLLKNINKQIPFKDCFIIFYLSMFVNSILPAKAGDFYRGYLYKKFEGRSFSQSVGTIILERILDLISIGIIIVISGFLCFNGNIPNIILNSLYFIIFAILTITIFIAILFKIEKQNFLGSRLQKIINNLKIGLKAFKKENLFLIILISLVSWFIEGLTLYFVFLSLNIKFDILTSVFLELSASLLTAVPFTPSGLGVVELSMKYLLVNFFNLDVSSALAVILLYRSISFISIVIFGSILNFIYNIKN